MSLFSRRREFIDSFAGDMDFSRMPWLGDHASSADTMNLIAEFYFKHNFWEDAIRCYSRLLEVSDSVNPQVYQKIGFAHQSMGNIEQALENYHRYELADDTDVWTLRHIAACLRMLKRYDEAVDYYRKVDTLKPGQVSTTLNLGHCLLEKGDLDGAMQCYYKVDLDEHSSRRAWRPLAWCSFLQGNLQRSIDYYMKLADSGLAETQEYVNMGHVYACLHDIAHAIEAYGNALKHFNGDNGALEAAALEDSQLLVNHGVSLDDLSLLVDAAISQSTNND